jgi:hypothetical protein
MPYRLEPSHLILMGDSGTGKYWTRTNVCACRCLSHARFDGQLSGAYVEACQGALHNRTVNGADPCSIGNPPNTGNAAR